jgi:hypothetical protein
MLCAMEASGVRRFVAVSAVPGGYSISRADVAHLMLAVLDDPATLRQAIGVAY